MADLTGQRLGQYLILERISKGATSTVYKAHQEKLERYVAVKVLSPHFIDEEGFLERFKQEARAVAQLDHPNILPVYDFDQVGDVVYIVMKYVDTGTLKELLGHPLDLRMSLEIFTQVGLALGYAHRQGVIHRDVKPGNILLGEGNWALLTDFGLAKIRAGDRKLTKSGVGMGTPDYMSPEQAQGMPVDGRADLYSLGCVLHEMLTGKVPFEADSGMAVVVKHITEPPRPPRELNPKLPLAVEQVIIRALEKDPTKRYQTAEAIVAGLARAVGRADQFILPGDLSLKSTASTRPAMLAARGKPVPAGPTRLEQARDWVSEKRPIVAANVRDAGTQVASSARGAGGWLFEQLRRLGRTIGNTLARFARWLRRMVIALIALLRRAASQMRARITGQPANRQTARSGRSSSSRSRTSTTRTRLTRSKKSSPMSTTQLAISQVAERVRAAVKPARKHVTRRRLAVAGVVIAIVLLLALVALRSAEGAEGRIPGYGALAVDSAPISLPTVTDAPVAATDTPTAELTATAQPVAPPGMVVVSGGTFKMGATAGRFDPDETPPHWATLGPFYIDAVEVTVAQFARFADGSGYVTDAEKKGDATTWRAQDAPDRKYFPVNRVSWNDAATFCRWYGKRLPTEAEWELAAKGFSQNIYTRGNNFSSDRTNTRERGVGQPIAVANLANVSPFGAYDMIGNLWEWTADWYAGDYYAVSPATNPTGPASGQERVIRGGSFKSEGERATTTIRRKASQDGWADDIGFRCVKDVTE